MWRCVKQISAFFIQFAVKLHSLISSDTYICFKRLTLTVVTSSEKRLRVLWPLDNCSNKNHLPFYFCTKFMLFDRSCIRFVTQCYSRKTSDRGFRFDSRSDRQMYLNFYFKSRCNTGNSTKYQRILIYIFFIYIY